MAAEESLIVNGEAIAMMIKNPAHLSLCHIDASRECPNCNYHIDNSNVSSQWLGLPTGVKFDPSDLQLLAHLEGKIARAVSHELIDYFIPTIEEEEGICYTHPENLLGMKTDGSISHFFHKISNAYDVGTRKRRKISNSYPTVCDEHFRWHKTGKSRKIKDNGVIKGWKKIMVLYSDSRKDDAKTGWAMHQYHLGEDEDEKHGELVVSKVFYQLQSKKAVNKESNSFAGRIDPTTPMTYPPQPRHPNSSPSGTELNQEDTSLFCLDEHPSHDGIGPENQPLPPNTDALYPENQPLPLPPDTGALCLDYTCLGSPPDNTSLAEDTALFGLDEHPSYDGIGPDAAYAENQPLPPGTDALYGFPYPPPETSCLPDTHSGSQDSLSNWLDSVLHDT